MCQQGADMLRRMYPVHAIFRNSHISYDSACDPAWKKMYDSHSVSASKYNNALIDCQRFNIH